MHGTTQAVDVAPSAGTPLTTSRPRRSLKERVFGETPSAWLFILPAVVLLATIYVVPFGWSLLLSFKADDLVTPSRWVGLGNYRALAKDPQFGAAVRHTLVYAALYVPLTIGLGMTFALMLNRRIRFIGIYRTLIIVPFVVSYAVQGILFSFIFDSQYGLANAALHAVGIGRQGFFNDPGQALYLIALVGVWSGTGFCLIVFLAALQDVPRELMEAAWIDGARRWGVFRHVIVPTLMPIIVFLLLWQTLIALQLFDLVYVTTNGGPLESTTVVVFFVYEKAFRLLSAGYGAAAAYLVGLGLIALAVLSSFVRNRWMRSA